MYEYVQSTRDHKLPKRILVAERDPVAARALVEAFRRFEYTEDNARRMRELHYPNPERGSAFCMLDPGAVDHVADVRDAPRAGVAFVSPANSLAFMDGGFDRALSRDMFPGLEAAARDKVASLGLRTALGRPYLPVGSAVVVPVGDAEGDAVVAVCPTMFLPHDVSGTRNAEHAFMAALCAFSKFVSKTGARIDTLVTPALCCGYGQMAPDESARQMAAALSSFLRGRLEPQYAGDDATMQYLRDPQVYLTMNRDHEQPDNYDNREIKDVPLASLMNTTK